LTRQDGLSFFEMIEQSDIRIITQPFPLHEANLALDSLRSGTLVGTAVLVPPAV
jgi:propanol-preferring alcohol dehydrogenase